MVVYGRDDLDRVTTEKWYSNATPAPNVGIATTTQGGVVNEVQRVGYTATMIMGGTFTLTHDGQTTSPIAYNATAATVKSALEGLSSIGSGNVEVVRTQNGSFTYEWQLTFQGSKAGTNVVQSTINTTSISAMGGVTKIEATDTTGGVFDEVQTVTVNNATGGVFRLAFMGQTTAPIAYNASAATVETALESLNSVDNVSVTGSAGGPWTITFAGSHAGYNVSTITGDASMLTNGTLERTMSFVYDAASQLTSTTDPDSTYTYSYDALGRVTSVDNDGTSGVPRVILASAYDSASNRTSLAATIAGTADFKNDYTYDALQRLTRLDQTGQGGGNTVAEKRIDFSYNSLGQFTAIARFKDTDGGSTHEVATSSFTFDTLNRLTDLEYKKGGTDLFTPYSFSYDTLGRITSTTNQDGTTDYTYDKTSQLTAADHSYQTDETYTFDANGNRTMTGYTTGSNNRLTSDGTYNYTYDDEGNRTLRTKISDGSKTEYGWDYRNRLIRITEKTSGGTVTKESLYTYDQFDRRLSKSVDPDGPGGASAVLSRFIYDGDNIVLVFGGSSANDLKNRYLHGPAVDQILADEQVTSLSSAGSVLWTLADNQGTIRDLVNNSAVVQNHLEYDSFGAVTAESNAAVDHLYGYTGRERDEESGLNFYRARYYDEITGRFVSEDPIGFLALDVNLVRYVGNAPANFVDPTGTQVHDPKSRPLLTGPPFKDNPPDYSTGASIERNVLYPANGNAPNMDIMAAKQRQRKADARELQREMAEIGGFAPLLNGAEASVGNDLLDPEQRKLSPNERLGRVVHVGAAILPPTLDEIIEAARLARKAKPAATMLTEGQKRLIKYGHNWQFADVKKAIAKFAGPKATAWRTNTGKTIFENPATGVQVVIDDAGYFRIFKPDSIGSKEGVYLDMLGKVPAPARKVKGGAIRNIELTGPDLQASTHFICQ